MKATSTVEAKAGDYITPDEWTHGELLCPGDDFAPLRLPAGGVDVRGRPFYMLATRVQVTGSPHYNGPGGREWRSRARVTFIGDGEPDVVTGAWLMHDLA
jgi:hypothetical protein